MKKIIFILAVFACMTMVQAQTFNPTVTSNHFDIGTLIIRPFLVWDVTPSSTPSLPDIIQGQSRDLNHHRIQLFQLQKEANYNVGLTLSCPEPVGGVDLVAHWYFTDTPPPDDYDFGLAPLSQNFNWFGTATDGYIFICVTKITASASATPGKKTFTASASGQYTGL